MSFYTKEISAEAMREKARIETEKAKRVAAEREARRQRRFQRKTAPDETSPSIDSAVLESMTRDELYEHAKQIGVRGRSRMLKAELIEALRHNW
ncbi:MAG: Rho termination factor N-terminal domain-containing protein [Bryobacterales bacterium]